MSVSNIKSLVRKDLSLLLHPTVYIFFACAAFMLFIPNYPRITGFFYLLIGIMNIFTLDLQYRDHEASGLLPVKKRESVLARLLTVMGVELAQLVFTVPFAFAAGSLMEKWGVSNNAGMNINITLYAVILIGYSVYNVMIFPGAYQKQFKIQVRSFVGMLLYFVVTVLLENLVSRPRGGTLFLNGTTRADLALQAPVLIGALALYFGIAFIAFRIAAARYENAEI